MYKHARQISGFSLLQSNRLDLYDLKENVVSKRKIRKFGALPSCQILYFFFIVLVFLVIFDPQLNPFDSINSRGSLGVLTGVELGATICVSYFSIPRLVE